MTHLTALVVDSSNTYLHLVSTSLQQLGVPDARIVTCKKYSDAKAAIEEHQPDILISEFTVDGKFGLELVKFHNSLGANKISIILTHNNSSSSIAEAAEELVDDYLVKPFQGGLLQERFNSVIKRKLHPNPYIKSIRAGKQMLLEGRLQDAAVQFESAMQIEQKPTLAHYYLGYTKFVENKLDFAVGEFQKGLDLQPLHYKCLIGNFDAFFEQKAYKSAHAMASSIVDNYPISAKRLSKLFISTVYSGHLDAIPQYFDLFTRMENVTGELRGIFSAALLAAGKSQIMRGNIQKAVESFEMGLHVLGPDLEYAGKVIRTLLKTNSLGISNAERILRTYFGSRVGTKEYNTLGFLISCALLPTAQVIEQGRRLASARQLDAECYEIFVKMLVDDRKLVLAEDIATKAIAEFPDLRKTLNALIDQATNSTKQNEKGPRD